ncbi:GNAT family N-acetyltransferase [Martelella endophytica]|uniref:Acetyltransferase n=1 Tax=Martelella endophytica TaxID=1486262 RepID=A0A0D5LVR8_MAREN|nr:GNAT family protein [Martelella endophytica]AJY48121.1 acetyltransferase [Martelella endophytica]
MEDLSRFTPRLRPQPVHQRGISVTVEPYDVHDHGAGLWQALGREPAAVNALLQYFPNQDFTGRRDFDAWLDEQNASGQYVTRVFRRAGGGEIVGMASYMRIDERNGVIEVGAVAHGPAMQRSVMATEVHYLMARHAFDDLHYRRYEWKCHNENAKSKASAARLGFTFEGVFRKHMVAKGRNRDTAWFSMIDEEWPVIRAAFEAWLSPENFDGEGRQRRELAEIRAELAQ